MDSVNLPAQKAAFVNDLFRRFQDTWETLQDISSVGGVNYILKGCVVNGSSVSSGIMVLSGEVVPFIGGSIPVSAKVVIEETVTEEAVGTGSFSTVDRVAKFGVGGVEFFWKPLDLNRFSPQALVSVHDMLDGFIEGEASLVLSGCYQENIGGGGGSETFDVTPGKVYLGSRKSYFVDAHNVSRDVATQVFYWEVYVDEGVDKSRLINSETQPVGSFLYNPISRLKPQP